MKKSTRYGIAVVVGILCFVSLSSTFALGYGGGKSSMNKHKGWENRWKGWENHWGTEGPPGGNPHGIEEEPPAEEEEPQPEEEEETPEEEEEEAPAEEEEEAPAEEEEY